MNAVLFNRRMPQIGIKSVSIFFNSVTVCKVDRSVTCQPFGEIRQCSALTARVAGLATVNIRRCSMTHADGPRNQFVEQACFSNLPRRLNRCSWSQSGASTSFENWIGIVRCDDWINSRMWWQTYEYTRRHAVRILVYSSQCRHVRRLLLAATNVTV